jgi:hypothetical protein
MRIRVDPCWLMTAKLGLYINEIEAKSRKQTKFTWTTTGYTRWDCGRNLGIIKEINTQPITKFWENYSSNWKIHVRRIFRSSIPFQILSSQPKGRRSLKRLQRLARDGSRPLGLRYGRLMMMRLENRMELVTILRYYSNIHLHGWRESTKILSEDSWPRGLPIVRRFATIGILLSSQTCLSARTISSFLTLSIRILCWSLSEVYLVHTTFRELVLLPSSCDLLLLWWHFYYFLGRTWDLLNS